MLQQIPWNRIFEFLSFIDLAKARLASKKLKPAADPLFSIDRRNSLLYTNFVKGLTVKHLTNSNYQEKLSGDTLKYYNLIKAMRTNLIQDPSESKVKVQCTIFDLPPWMFDIFNSFLHPSTGVSIAFKDLMPDVDKEDKNYATVFNTNDFRVILKATNGTTMKISKQLLHTGRINPIVKISESETEEEKGKPYEAFYSAAAKPDLEIDFSNPAMLMKRQEKMLKAMQEAPVHLDFFQTIRGLGIWIILMCHGGNFSFGAFKGKELIEHKSDKKYLVRKKAGRRQTNKDKTKNVMTSVGSQLRREMDKVHQEHIGDILEDSKKYFSEADIIFLHAPGINKSFFVAEGKPLREYVNKIRPVIIKTEKANFTNVMAVFEKLTKIQINFDAHGIELA